MPKSAPLAFIDGSSANRIAEGDKMTRARCIPTLSEIINHVDFAPFVRPIKRCNSRPAASMLLFAV
jgi:hypothetical protein